MSRVTPGDRDGAARFVSGRDVRTAAVVEVCRADSRVSCTPRRPEVLGFPGGLDTSAEETLFGR